MSVKWFLGPDVVSGARMRLFCLPYAGGGAAVYREWGAHAPAWCQVLPVQLPGRGWRLGEEPIAELPRLAEMVSIEVARLADRPFGIFGHSMGAWLAFEVARRLERAGSTPHVLFVSGRQAPSLRSTQPPLSHLPDDRFVEMVQARYGGIPQEILANPDVLELVLPALRSDLTAIERYVYAPERTLACPIVALGGESDTVVPAEDLATWSAETTGSFEIETFPGGHFYFQPHAGSLVAALMRRLAADVSVANGSVQS